jgi:hypothetical protein
MSPRVHGMTTRHVFLPVVMPPRTGDYNAELTRAEHEAHNLICTDNDESHAIEASRLNELLDRHL